MHRAARNSRPSRQRFTVNHVSGMPLKRHRGRRARQSAFTLIEMLVAIALLALVAVLC
ncbi:MAG TPA: type II secretion system protein [Paraburkholderia sp.]|nr:type II secretion system protein [Paraburkholderia sp.]